MRLRDAVEDVLDVLEDDLALVGHSDAKAHCPHGVAREPAVDVRQGGCGNDDRLPVDPARKEAKFFPDLLSLLWSKPLDDQARLVGEPVEVLLDEVAEPEGDLGVAPAGIDPEPPCKRPEFLRLGD
ncbi:hypothetical protein DSECCO2_523330 [anaerobic digester metagenome]